ncbi:MAG: ABC transporter permease [Candidatus Bathyarchaeia archaeon]
MVGIRSNIDAASVTRRPENLSLVYYLTHDKQALMGLIIAGAFLIWSIIEGGLQVAGYILKKSTLGWALLPYNPIAPPNMAIRLLPPSLSHLMGTNYIGEDIFSRVLYAAPKDALAAVLVVSVAVIFGGTVGSIAGYYGGWMDEALMRLTDAFLALPALVLAIAISVLLGFGFDSVLIALLVIWWPIYARLFRGQALTLKYRGFVEVSRLFGINGFKILFKHIFLNAIDPAIAYAALDFGTVILTYSTLAFLGIGIQPPYPEWGAMASNGLTYFPQAWWYVFFPSLVILLVVISFIFIGDRFQDIIAGRVNY